MMIKFSPLAAGSKPVLGAGVHVSEASTVSLAENKVIPFRPPTAPRTIGHYPQELTPQPKYITETKAKPFPHESPELLAAAKAFDLAIFGKVLDEAEIGLVASKIIDSGLGQLPSEFFPEAA